MRARMLFVLLCCRMMYGSIGSAQPILVLHDGKQSYSLAGHLSYCLVQSTTLSVDEIASPGYRDRFQFLPHDNPRFGITSDILWLRFRLSDTSVVGREWMFENSYASVGNVNLYFRDKKGGWQEEITGADVPFHQRTFRHRRLLLPLPSLDNTATEFYVRIWSQSSLSFPLNIVDKAVLATTDQREYFSFGMFNGILFIMFLYNLFLAFSIREPAYIAYTVYIVCYGTYQSILDGIGEQFVFTDLHFAPTTIAIGAVWLTVSASCYFAIVYLKLQRTMKRMYSVLVTYSAIGVGFSLYALLIDARVANFAVSVSVMVFAPLQLACGIVRLRQGYAPARFYVLAVGGYIAGLTVRIMRNFGVFPNTEWALYAFHAGIIWEFALLSFGLADRINAVKEEESRERERLRNQIAADLHDEIGSSLSSISVNSQMLARNTSLTDDEKRKLKSISVVARQTMDAIRDVIWFINPEHDAEDLAFKLKETAHQMLACIDHVMTFDPTVSFVGYTMEQRRDFYLIYKECLNNIVHHAHATNVDISIRRSNRHIDVKIADDGVGFQPDHLLRQSGILNMRQRAAKLDAKLTISSTAGRGTEIRLDIPVEKKRT